MLWGSSLAKRFVCQLVKDIFWTYYRTLMRQVLRRALPFARLDGDAYLHRATTFLVRRDNGHSSTMTCEDPLRNRQAHSIP